MNLLHQSLPASFLAARAVRRPLLWRSSRRSARTDAGHSSRVHDQRLPGRPDQLLDAGVRGLRDARDDVEASLRPGGSRPARAGHGERRAIRPGGSGSAVLLRDEGPGRHPVRATQLVRPGTPPRLPLRAAALGEQARRRTGADQARAGQPAMPAPQVRASSRMAPRPHVRHTRVRRRSCSEWCAWAAKKTPYCSSRGLNYIRTFKAQATVVDVSPPAVGIVQDNAFTRGEWVSGCRT